GVEHRLRRPGRVPVYAARDEHDQHSVAAGDGSLDDVPVVGRARDNGDPTVEVGELGDALLTAYRDDLVPPVERVPDQVLAELAGRADDGDPHDAAAPGATSPDRNIRRRRSGTTRRSARSASTAAPRGDQVVRGASA